MKKLLIILCLLCFTLPCFCASGYYEGCNDNIKPYDDRGTQAYAQQLEKEYHAKVDKGDVDCCGPTYVEYVEYPLFKYIEEHPINYSESDD